MLGRRGKLDDGYTRTSASRLRRLVSVVVEDCLEKREVKILMVAIDCVSAIETHFVE